MSMRIIRGALAAGVVVLLAGHANATPGYVVEGVNLRAGPGVDYPLLAPLPDGTPTDIIGCLSGFTWCDVAVNGPEGALRGWAAGPRLAIAYEGQPELLPEYGPRFGFPIVGFDLGGYWGRYYRDRPFYADEGRWRGEYHGGPGPGPGFDGNRGGFRPDARGDLPHDGFPHGGFPGGQAGGVRPNGNPGGERFGGERPGPEPGRFRPEGGPRGPGAPEGRPAGGIGHPEAGPPRAAPPGRGEPQRPNGPG